MFLSSCATEKRFRFALFVLILSSVSVFSLAGGDQRVFS